MVYMNVLKFSLRLTVAYLLGYLWLQGPSVHAAVNRSGLRDFCERIRGLSQNQKKTCITHVDQMQELARGGQLALAECANQFRDERWQCDRDRNMIFSTFFNFWVQEDNPEAAYVAAIRSAGFVHRIAAGCDAGNISNCECGRDEYATADQLWYWHGCVNSVQYAIDLLLAGPQRFLRNEERQGLTPARKSMDSHNYLVGGKTVNILQSEPNNLKCHCHGVSRSCTLKTCVPILHSFAMVGAELKRKYRSARRVAAVYRNGENKAPDEKVSMMVDHLVVEDSQPPQGPSINDLVYLQASPDYCETYPLPSGRHCSNPQVCQHVCCGLEYESEQLVLREPCPCRFHEDVMSVRCNCTEHLTVYHCGKL